MTVDKVRKILNRSEKKSASDLPENIKLKLRNGFTAKQLNKAFANARKRIQQRAES